MKTKRFLLPLLILAIIGACAETDIAVPGFPQMVDFFDTTEEMVQMTLTINFLAFALAGLFYGPLSESWGRRRVMLFGSAIFTLGALGTAWATTLPALIAWRFFQGLGAGALLVVSLAMVAEAYSGDRAARAIGVMNATITLVMATAPMLGGFLTETYGWRANYTSVAGIGLLGMAALSLFLPETLEQPRKMCLRGMMRDYSRLLSSGEFLLFSTGPSILCAGYMGFVGTAVFYFVRKLEMGVTEFTWYQASVIMGFSVFSYFSGNVVALLGRQRATVGSICLAMAGALSMTIACVVAPTNAVLITAGMTTFSVGTAVFYAVIFAVSMEIFPDLKGAASAMLMTMRLLVIMFSIWLCGYLYVDTFTPVAAVILGATLVVGTQTVMIMARPDWRARLA